MIIEQVETYPLFYKNPHFYGDANGFKKYRALFLIRILTRSGLVGWGECVDWLPTLQVGFKERIIPFLIGKDALYRTAILTEVKKWHSRSATAVSMALTEIAAQGAGVHISEYWGGRLRDQIPVYASFQSYSQEKEWVAHSINLVEKAALAGFKDVKIKIGGKPISEDMHHIESLCQTFGGQLHFALDANQSYDVSTANQWGQMLAGRKDILWLEEPMPIRLVEEYDLLRKRISLPVAGGENLRDVASFLSFLQKGAMDILQPDVMHTGDVDEFRRVLHLARDFGVRVSPHSFDGPLSRFYTLVAMACLPPWSKMKGDDLELVEWDVMDSPFIKLFSLSPQKGEVTLPKGIGTGIEMNMEIFTRYRWDGERYG